MLQTSAVGTADDSSSYIALIEWQLHSQGAHEQANAQAC